MASHSSVMGVDIGERHLGIAVVISNMQNISVDYSCTVDICGSGRTLAQHIRNLNKTIISKFRENICNVVAIEAQGKLMLRNIAMQHALMVALDYEKIPYKIIRAMDKYRIGFDDGGNPVLRSSTTNPDYRKRKRESIAIASKYKKDISDHEADAILVAICAMLL